MALKAARERAGLTQEQAARLLGVTGRTISRWETEGARDKDSRNAIRTYEEYANELPPRLDKQSRHHAPSIVAIGDKPYSAGRKELCEVLKGRRTLKWLLDFRDEIHRLGGNIELEDRAIQFVTDERTLRSLLDGVAAEGGGFTEDEALSAMESAAAAMRARLYSATPAISESLMKPAPDTRQAKKPGAK